MQVRLVSSTAAKGFTAGFSGCLPLAAPGSCTPSQGLLITGTLRSACSGAHCCLLQKPSEGGKRGVALSQRQLWYVSEVFSVDVTCLE